MLKHALMLSPSTAQKQPLFRETHAFSSCTRKFNSGLCLEISLQDQDLSSVHLERTTNICVYLYISLLTS